MNHLASQPQSGTQGRDNALREVQQWPPWVDATAFMRLMLHVLICEEARGSGAGAARTLWLGLGEGSEGVNEAASQSRPCTIHKGRER